MAKNIMIQGTMSNVGKSVLCAALCRIFTQDGYRCAPFKSQNMALNSGVTQDGLEMGRAQIMQAQAARIKPRTCMNPILLKPSTDTGSQVIVNGKVRGQYSAREYFSMRTRLIPEILAAYEELDKEYDIIVIEGAGSPAEINLKENDIVNMGLARMLDAPVLLAGDIDPGGVFAQLYGTVMLLEEEERSRIRGLIINKFRGDRSLLEPGCRMLEEKVDIPVLGVVPWIRADLDDEDSMSGQLLQKSHDRPIDIAVIRLPRISNFTDLNPLEANPLLGVRYVQSVQELGTPDLIILPGTKSTIPDLEWLRKTGLAGQICKIAEGGGHVIGICGGFQMLGMVLSDPFETESSCAKEGVRGLGLLPVRTVFESDKTLRNVEEQISEGFLKGAFVRGYEIHNGSTFRCDPDGPDLEISSCSSGTVYGTYLHGLFDSGEAVDILAKELGGAKGIRTDRGKTQDRSVYLDLQFDLLSEAVRANLDMEAIYRIAGLKV